MKKDEEKDATLDGYRLQQKLAGMYCFSKYDREFASAVSCTEIFRETYPGVSSKTIPCFDIVSEYPIYLFGFLPTE